MVLTNWYPPSIKPKRKGVYMTSELNQIWFQYWSGTYWKLRSDTINGAYKLREFKSQHQRVYWRGLTK